LCFPAIEGEVAHWEGPQRIKVCMVKKANTNATYGRYLRAWRRRREKAGELKSRAC
jgi:hypothetical protein